jgi:hypothetical protein
LRVDAPGRADAVARLGGPFVRVIEFVTPEEASQQLGHVIVGGPACADEPYDLEVTFTRSRGSKPEQHTFHVKGATESQILDMPFAFDGQIQTARWEAVVRITWKGQPLTYTHQSRPLFPTVPTWRALIYSQDKNPITLDQVMDDAGRLRDALSWKAYGQSLEGLHSLDQPHFIIFSWMEEYREQVRAGESLAGYLTATVISPDERDVVVEFLSGGPTDFYLNGQKVEVIPVEEIEGIHPLFRQARRTAVMRLRAGENTLLVDTRPSPPPERFLSFSGAFMTPDGDVMTDLVFG